MGLGSTRLATLLCTLLAATSGSSHAVDLVQTRLNHAAAQAGIGHEYRASVEQASRQLLDGKIDQALPALRQAMAYCDAQLARDNLHFVSVTDDAQYADYVAAHQDGIPVEWLDDACPSAYYMFGFALVARQRFSQALPYLDKAIAVAPFDPEPRNERALVLNQLGRLDDGIAGYRSVLALAEHYPATAYAAPIAWRGIGWALVERKDWEGARAAYKAALELEPDNALAARELDYIAEHADK